MTRNFVADMAERVVWTFVQGFLAAWIVVGDIEGDRLFTEANLKVGLAAGAVAAVKAVLASRIGSKDDASTLPTQ